MKKKSVFFKIQLNFLNKPLFEGLPTDYYVYYFYRSRGCYQCVQLDLKNDNIIQYRESYCVGGDSLERICSQLDPLSLPQIIVRGKNCDVWWD